MNRAVNERLSARASLARQIRVTEQRLVRRRGALAQRVTAVGRAFWMRIGLPASLLGAGAGGFLLARILLPGPRRGRAEESEEPAEAEEIADDADRFRSTHRSTLFERLLHLITLVQVVNSFVATARRNDRPTTSTGLSGSSGAAGAAGSARSTSATQETPGGQEPV